MPSAGSPLPSARRSGATPPCPRWAEAWPRPSCDAAPRAEGAPARAPPCFPRPCPAQGSRCPRLQGRRPPPCPPRRTQAAAWRLLPAWRPCPWTWPRCCPSGRSTRPPCRPWSARPPRVRPRPPRESARSQARGRLRRPPPWTPAPRSCSPASSTGFPRVPRRAPAAAAGQTADSPVSGLPRPSRCRRASGHRPAAPRRPGPSRRQPRWARWTLRPRPPEPLACPGPQSGRGRRQKSPRPCPDTQGSRSSQPARPGDTSRRPRPAPARCPCACARAPRGLQSAARQCESHRAACARPPSRRRPTPSLPRRRHFRSRRAPTSPRQERLRREVPRPRAASRSLVPSASCRLPCKTSVPAAPGVPGVLNPCASQQGRALFFSPIIARGGTRRSHRLVAPLARAKRCADPAAPPASRPRRHPCHKLLHGPQLWRRLHN